MVKIRCVVERVTYQNPENGYSVLKCAVKNYNELVTVVGNLLDANVGAVLLIDGNWKVDAKYGRQFLAESWEETMPAPNLLTLSFPSFAVIANSRSAVSGEQP